MRSSAFTFIPFSASPCTFLAHPVCQARAPANHSSLVACMSLESKLHVVVVGGGAAGFFAAITAARAAREAFLVTILEGSPTPLSKVRISGGGRCNVTSGLHRDDPRAFAANYPRGSRAMPSVLSRFSAADVIRFFEDEGVPLKVESTGKIFPVSDTSESVIAALVSAAKRAGVVVHTRARVVDLRQREGKFEVVVAKRDNMIADFIVVATGSALAPQRWAERMGHTVVPPVPSLFTFKVHDERLQALAGVAVEDCCVSLQLPKGSSGAKKRGRRQSNGLVQRGPLLFTHWGLSGPVILSLSAFGARDLNEEGYKLPCIIDWMPSLTQQEKVLLLRTAKRALGAKNVATVSPFSGKFPNRLWRYLLESVGLKASRKWGTLKNEDIDKIVEVLHSSVFQIDGKGEFKEEFVTAGGVALNSVNMKTFESKHCSSLYFAGEALDVDGRTGGFNLEFAWSSGYIAGASIAEYILQSNEVRQGKEGLACTEELQYPSVG